MAKYLRLGTWSAAGEKTKTLWSVIGLCLAILPINRPLILMVGGLFIG
jgi:hypothetical protein